MVGIDPTIDEPPTQQLGNWDCGMRLQVRIPFWLLCVFIFCVYRSNTELLSHASVMSTASYCLWDRATDLKRMRSIVPALIQWIPRPAYCIGTPSSWVRFDKIICCMVKSCWLCVKSSRAPFIPVVRREFVSWICKLHRNPSIVLNSINQQNPENPNRCIGIGHS